MSVINCFYIYIFRHEISSLEKLSPTDIECYWKNNKENHLLDDKPIPIQDYCHIVPVPEHIMSDEKKKRIREELCEMFPDSALAKFKKRYTMWTEKNDNSVERFVKI